MIWLAPALSSSAILGVVAVITGTRPIFILIYSIIPSLPKLKILEEPLDSSSLTIKPVSVAMIIGGIVSRGLLVEDRFTCFCPY